MTATFIKENAIDLTPPPPAPPDQPVNPQPTVLIRITEDSLVTVNGRLSDVGSVRAAIERRIAENPESAVLVQAHPRARNQLVIMIVTRLVAPALRMSVSQSTQQHRRSSWLEKYVPAKLRNRRLT